ncbi:MAG: VTT domain-containing protein [Bacteroidetes bacterium]|nr:VTT domain-containing protein [Bacteroidota bacterium]
MRLNLLFSLLMLCSVVTMAQKSLTLKLVNQYESGVGAVNIGNKQYQTEKDGLVTVDTDFNTGMITLSSQDYDALTLNARSLKNGDTIVLQKRFTWKDIMNPMFYILHGGLWLLIFIIFAETGLFAGFFLPGDSLLFVAGIYSSNLSREFLKVIGMENLQYESLDLMVLCSLLAVAGILGNAVGYWTGRKVGPSMYHWKDNMLFKRRYLTEAQGFYDKHGGAAIVFARFLPFIRTFAPIIGGIVGMDKKKFTFYNVVGSISWVVSMIFAGHFLQIWVKKQFGIELKDKLELIVIIIIAVTTAPVLWKFFFAKKKTA